MIEFEEDDDRERDEIEAVQLLLRRKGARVAFNTAIEVCEDRKAPAAARAAAASMIFRAAGMFAVIEPSSGKPPSEMTPAELDREVERSTRLVQDIERDRAARRAASETDVDPFG